MTHPLAGSLAPAEMWLNPDELRKTYFQPLVRPVTSFSKVAFGTSGHRGSPLKQSFNEEHILAITQATVECRRQNGVAGPLFVGRDTHAASEWAMASVLRVLAAMEVPVVVPSQDGVAPTPVLSHAILTWNRQNPEKLADGLLITPSHNPPEDGGIKYNPPHGGPADASLTRWIESRANELLNLPSNDALLSWNRTSSALHRKEMDIIGAYIADLPHVVNIEAAREVPFTAHPLGGAALPVWHRIAEDLKMPITLHDASIDPRFSFVPLDHDGRIRMDCSSPFAMASVVALAKEKGLCVGNDTDGDRHGIVTPLEGLLNPNLYLALSIQYLLKNRPQWSNDLVVGKTAVSSQLIDRVVTSAGHDLMEVPVGFKWFVPGLYGKTLAFGGEESAGASFLRFDGNPWSTDKDGLIMGLLAAEMVAQTGYSIDEQLKALREDYGVFHYRRVDLLASAEDKNRLAQINPQRLVGTVLAGEKVVEATRHASGNQAPLGGIKILSDHAWCALRPSGTENLLKIYAESSLSPAHLSQLLEDARQLLESAG